MTGPNAQQREAAAALRGAVLISAGAGSGKTRTLVDRFVNALGESGDPDWIPAAVDRILAITFTDKAAGEIAERVRAALNESGRVDEARQCDAAWISTIHGFCSRLLRRYALEAGLDPSYALLEGARVEILRERAFEDACRRDDMHAAAELFSTYRFDEVYSAVLGLADHHTTRPHTLALVAERGWPAERLLDRAIEVLGNAREDVRSCGDPGKQAAQLLEGCCETVDMLEALGRSQLDDTQLASEIWKTLERFNPKGHARAIKETVAQAKEHRAELIAKAATTALESKAAALIGLTLAFEQEYARLKSEKGVLDFEDLQVRTVELLRERDDVRRAVQKRFTLAMVDEFQDTNALQLALVSAAAGENLCTVGDAQQSIYRFRGAQVEVYRQHRAHMRSLGAREFELTVNYRSHADVLAFVNHVFQPLFGESYMALSSGREAGGVELPEDVPRAEVTFVKTERNSPPERGARLVEAHVVAERFAQLRDDHGFVPSDMVVLLGGYRHAQVYADALTRKGFSVSVVGGSRFFSAPEIVTIRALLAVIVNPAHEQPLATLLASEAVRVSDDALWEIGALRKNTGATLWEAVENAAESLRGEDATALAALVDAVDAARTTAGAVPLPELIVRAMERLDYDLVLAAQSLAGSDALANVMKLLSLASESEATGDSGPAAFVAALDARERYGEHTTPATDVASAEGVVQIMSIHSSKGLEFPVVALPELGATGATDRSIALWESDAEQATVCLRLPSSFSSTKNSSDTYSAGYARRETVEDRDARAEKQRLFYVGCTRARDVLLLSGAGAFSHEPDPDGPLAIDWVRNAVGQGLEPDGQRSLMELDDNGATCAVTMIDAAAWHDARADAGSAPPDAPASTIGEESRSIAQLSPTVLETSEGQATGQAAVAPRLSFTDFSTFDTCQKRYWVSRVLRMGSRVTSESSDPLVLGSVVHAALELHVTGVKLDEERLRAVAASMGLPGSRLGELRDAVAAFIGSQTAADLARHDSRAAEWPFLIPVAGEGGGFILVGSVDAYARSGDSALIVDYKTGRSGDPDELASRYRLQASIYAYAALADGATDIEVVFSRPQAVTSQGEPEEVRYHFTADDAGSIREDMVARHAAITQSAFPARDRWDRHICGTCPAFGTVCEMERSDG